MKALRTTGRRLARSAALTLLTVSSVFVVTRARALEVGLELDDCSNLSESRVRELTELELATKVVSPASQPLAALVSVRCAEAEVLIRVTDATTGKFVARTFTLTEKNSDVRARAVALAAAELVLTSWMELVLSKPAEPARATAAWLVADRRAASALVRRRTERGTRLEALTAFAAAGGTFRAMPGALGGGVRASFVIGDSAFGFDGDVSATFAKETTPLGEVRSNVWSIALRPALRLELGSWTTSVGVGGRAGLARVEGSTADRSVARGRVVAGTWAGPLVHANVGLDYAHFASRLGVEAGFALRAVSGTVDSRDEAGVRGVWILLTLGFGWRP